MKRALIALSLAATAGIMLVDSSRNPVKAVTDPVYSYFPSASNLDGRMLCLAGTPLETLAGTTIEMRIGVPSTSSSFQVGVFDGDTGKNPAGAIVDPGGSWDAGSAELEYTLFADPMANGAGTAVIGRWFGNRTNGVSGTNWTASAATMPDNNWWNLTVNTATAARSPAGHYFYRLTIRLLDPNATSVAAFKLRTSGGVSLSPGTVGYMAVLNQYNDGYVVYPTWSGDYPPADPFFFTNAPSTYDGSWRFHLDLNASTTELRFWDGDLDKGNNAAVTEPALLSILDTVDTKDPDSPDVLPDFATLGNERIESAQGVGSPEDDSLFDLFRRSPALEYNVTDPRGKVYRIENPSGNLEWEQFKISTDSSAFRPLADYSPIAADDDTAFVNEPRLAPGIWRVELTGQDMGNLCFLRFDRAVLGVDAEGDPITPLRPLLLGDLVWRDLDLDGVKDTGESGIAGIVVDLLDASGVFLESTTTDANGLYSFNVVPGTYTTRINYGNFGPGRPLLGLTSTTGGSKRTATLTNANLLTYDFGYHFGSTNVGLIPIAGTVWHDVDGDGAQETSEPGFANVKVTLTPLLGSPSVTFTDETGSFEFSNLLAGVYTITVDTTTLPSGLRQTYDTDGLSSANQATTTIASTLVNSGVSFGYTAATASTGPFTTQTQGGWGSKPSGGNPGAKLAANFATVYPSGFIQIGGQYTLRFTSASAVEVFLPQGGTTKALTASSVNPTGKISVFAGQVLALQISSDFSAAQAGGHRGGLGALTVQSGKLAGRTVAQVLAMANAVLGGTASALPSGVTLSDLNDTVSKINECFVDGTTNTGYVR